MRRPLSVGIVCHFPPPPGGMPGQAKALLTSLRREGIGAVAIPTNLAESRLGQRLDSIRFLRTVVRWPVFVSRLVRSLRAVDVLHVHTCSGLYFFLFATTAVVLGRLVGRRVLLHYHSGAAEAFLGRWRWAVAPTIHLADAIIVPSAFLQRVFAQFGWRATVISNICELDRFGFRAGPVVPRLIVARHLEATYNVACVLRAFAIVRQRRPDATLMVLGGGPEESRLRQLSHQLGLDNAVTFAGYVDNDDVPELFARASIFVNASSVDNMPISILEAFASGLPVVTTAAGGIPVLVEHEHSGLLVPLDDHQALARGVERLLDDPALALRLTANGLRTAEGFSWHRVFPALLASYAPAASTDQAVAFSDSKQ